MVSNWLRADSTSTSCRQRTLRSETNCSSRSPTRITARSPAVVAAFPVRRSRLGSCWYAVTKNDLIDVSYVGSHGVKLAQGGLNLDQLPTADLALGNQLLQQVPNPYYGKIASSGCGLSSPTVAAGQLLLPYPEFCSVNIAQP